MMFTGCLEYWLFRPVNVLVLIGSGPFCPMEVSALGFSSCLDTFRIERLMIFRKGCPMKLEDELQFLLDLYMESEENILEWRFIDCYATSVTERDLKLFIFPIIIFKI